MDFKTVFKPEIQTMSIFKEGTALFHALSIAFFVG